MLFEVFINKKKYLYQKLLQNIVILTLVADITQVSKSKIIEKILKKNYNEIKIEELNNIFSIYSSNTEIAKNILDIEINKILFDISNMEKFEISIKENVI